MATSNEAGSGAARSRGAYAAIIRCGISFMEANSLPDFLLRRAVRYLLAARLNESYKPTAEERLSDLVSFAKSLRNMPIAVDASAANSQHYEVPTEFYKHVLGTRLKYSAALFSSSSFTLDQAEEAMLELYCERAQLLDGQAVLDLGCGWGSLSLFLAEKYPNSQITSVSNSATQKDFIDDECRKRGLLNVRVVTCDINTYQAAPGTFDRMLSIEMFEHMKNYGKLLKNISNWMKPDGLLFIHIFCHRAFAYHFENAGDDDWMARSFFTGGTMPASNLLLYFQEHVSIVNHWLLSGTHYARTSQAWLKKMDDNIESIRPIFAQTYGEAVVTKWIGYWRTFFIAVAELFNFNSGQEWMVSHYLFKPRSSC